MRPGNSATGVCGLLFHANDTLLNSLSSLHQRRDSHP